MNSKFRNVALSLAAIASLLCGTAAQAGIWSNTNGNATSGHFTWTGGQDVNGRFGNPTYAYTGGIDRFIFNFQGFGVNDGGANAGDAFVTSKYDMVSWDMHLNPGFQLTTMRVVVRGSYNVSGEQSRVDMVGNLRVEEAAAQFPEPLPRFEESDFINDPFPVVSTATQPRSGTYTAIAEVEIPFALPMWDNDVHVSFENYVEAFAVALGNANINQTVQDFQIEIELVPEPATLALLGFGAVALLRRRR